MSMVGSGETGRREESPEGGSEGEGQSTPAHSSSTVTNYLSLVGGGSKRETKGKRGVGRSTVS